METLSYQVPGLLKVPNFVTPSEEADFIKYIDENQALWLTDLKRRVQHYGYRYSYRKNRLPAYIGPLPDWLHLLGVRLHDAGLMSSTADQAIINLTSCYRIKRPWKQGRFIL